MNIFRGIRHEMLGAVFLLRNLRGCHRYRMIPLPEERQVSFALTGAKPELLGQLQKLHIELRQGRRLNTWRLIMLYLAGNRLCSVALDRDRNLLGFQLLYFQEQEWRQGVIHEAFIGVKPEYRGLGIATALRLHSARHLAGQGRLSGISSQAGPENKASLRSAEKAGFNIVNKQQHRNRDETGTVLQLYCSLKAPDSYES